MNDVLTWGSVILAGGSVLAWVKFLLSVGSQNQKIDQAHSAAVAAGVRADAVAAQLNEHKIQTAEKFSEELRAAESRFASAAESIRAEVRSAVDGLRHDLRDMGTRLDKLLVGLLKRDE